jgi:AcrR family transcriptional regulator
MSSTASTSSRTGRRPGTTTSRDAIAAAARRLFAERGYDRATLRAIAGEAGVDPALVVHFFGSKEQLFRDVMQLPEAVADALASLADGPRDEIGRRLAEIVVGGMENPVTRPIVLGRVRSASSHPDAAELVRQTVTRDIGRLTVSIGVDDPEARAVLIGAQMVGVAFARYVVGVEPIASLPADKLVDLLAPTFQHYLTDSLS